MNQFSHVEQSFTTEPASRSYTTKIPYVVVINFPRLGFLTALRFLEWVSENPEGIISLPAGKTPEYFIKWVNYLESNWDNKSLRSLRETHGLAIPSFPEMKGLQFVQMDEFYPIDPRQHNSFYYYVKKFYIDGLGLDIRKALLINCEDIPLSNGKSLPEIFPDNYVDLSLRYRDCKTEQEKLQREAIFMVDQWCTEYENRIRDMGGIGFFLGGIGPDGHIAFNVRGSDLNSTTRLTETNFETQAAAAVDLGGIEISRNRLVITIGLSTITYNPDTTAIVIATGEAKAKMVQESLENAESIRYPATALQRLRNARFYLTKGAASKLTDRIEYEFQDIEKSKEKVERATVQLCQKLKKYGHHLTTKDLKNDFLTSRISGVNKSIVEEMINSIKLKINRGISLEENQTFLHTGPHHDDIMLGYLPHIVHLVRSPRNKHYFAVMTSGFTSVTNNYVKRVLMSTKSFLDQGRIEMTDYPDFFKKGYHSKWDKDVFHFLDKTASRSELGRQRGLNHRVVRALIEIYNLRNKTELGNKIDELCDYFDRCYDGEINPKPIQQLKGMIREFEEELVWAHYGIQVENIKHLTLGFYTGEIFSEIPSRIRDVKPVLDLLRETRPTVISLALDPEGSGPDVHYKVLQTIAEAIQLWNQEVDLSNVRIWGYRNVWYRFDPAEANIIVPVSLNSMAVLRDTFMSCYLSQKSASFPSYELDGPFCNLMQKIWFEQHELLELVLGRDFWYLNKHPRLRAAHGALFLKELSVDQFLQEARKLEESMEGQIK